MTKKARIRKAKSKSAVVVNTARTSFSIVQRSTKSVGWKVMKAPSESLFDRKSEKEKADLGVAWNILWSDLRLSDDELLNVRSFQKVNHFPGTTQLTRKYRMARRLAYMRARHPALYNFSPKTWALPAQLSSFKKQFSLKTGKSIRKQIFILKPDGSCMGKGIYLVNNWRDVKFKEDRIRYVAQQYIPNPLLIDGFKFDLRVYVLLISISPLRIYFYENGLVRLCTAKYKKPSSKNIHKTTMHLTNYSVNKHSKNYVNGDIVDEERYLEKGNCSSSNSISDNEEVKGSDISSSPPPPIEDDTEDIKIFNDWVNKNPESMESGTKRSIKWMNHWLQSSTGPNGGVSSQKVSDLWDNIADLCVKTIIAGQPAIAREYSSVFPHAEATEGSKSNGSKCFELLGFDIMLDDKLKPWLIEINASPSLNSDTKIDKRIKGEMIENIFRMLSTQVCSEDEITYRKRASKASRRRLYGKKPRNVFASFKKKNDDKKSGIDDYKIGTDQYVNNEGNENDEIDPDEEAQAIYDGRSLRETVLQRRLDKVSGSFHRIYPPLINSRWAKSNTNKSTSKRGLGTSSSTVCSRYEKLLETARQMDAEHGRTGMMTSPSCQMRMQKKRNSAKRRAQKKYSNSFSHFVPIPHETLTTTTTTTTNHSLGNVECTVTEFPLQMYGKNPKYLYQIPNPSEQIASYVAKKKAQFQRKRSTFWLNEQNPSGSEALQIRSTEEEKLKREFFQKQIETQAAFRRFIGSTNKTKNSGRVSPIDSQRRQNIHILKSVKHSTLRRTKSFENIQSSHSRKFTSKSDSDSEAKKTLLRSIAPISELQRIHNLQKLNQYHNVKTDSTSSRCSPWIRFNGEEEKRRTNDEGEGKDWIRQSPAAKIDLLAAQKRKVGNRIAMIPKQRQTNRKLVQYNKTKTFKHPVSTATRVCKYSRSEEGNLRGNNICRAQTSYKRSNTSSSSSSFSNHFNGKGVISPICTRKTINTI
eukprot:g4637.t1